MYKLIRRVRRFGTFSRANERGDIIVDKSRPLENPEPSPRSDLVAYRISEEVYEISSQHGCEGETDDGRVPIFTVTVRTVDLKDKKEHSLELEEELIES